MQVFKYLQPLGVLVLVKSVRMYYNLQSMDVLCLFWVCTCILTSNYLAC
jgi:hypothetical protein